MSLPDIFREAVRTAEKRVDFLCCARIESAACKVGRPNLVDAAVSFFRSILLAGPDPIYAEEVYPEWWNGDYTDHNQQMRLEALRLTLASAERAAQYEKEKPCTSSAS